MKREELFDALQDLDDKKILAALDQMDGIGRLCSNNSWSVIRITYT